MFGTLWFQRILEEPNGHVILTAWVLWVIASITLHELAHGWMATRYGDPTPVASGHMTLNPVVHMGIPSLVVFALSGIAWGAMPIDPTRMRGRYADAVVAFAGPAMNFILAAFCIVTGGVWLAIGGPTKTHAAPFGDAVYKQLFLFFNTGAILNIALGLFNLVPAPPLDGSRILGNLSRGYQRLMMSGTGRFLSAATFILAFFFAGPLIFTVGGYVSRIGMGVIFDVIDLIMHR